MLVGSFTFASNVTINTKTKLEKTEQITAKIEKSTSVILEDGVVLHSCTYAMYSNGEFLGYWTVSGMPDNVPCGSSSAMHYAIGSYNAYHEMFP
ncbi:hypothetical protein [Flavobacterium lacisediminis]|uniref:Uncharacterized protein n=1 Tax=Flavobacterium lacisediminis TaxID=2989705 RepID=A0ABT3EEN9_9FLAO|nr:hypothetical protein [Flavobacterium lacisediminis]MCW1147022.1 hypothetical protein [Flavobacterium lacisediminis]